MIRRLIRVSLAWWAAVTATKSIMGDGVHEAQTAAHLDFRTIQAFSKDLGMPLS